MRFWYARAAHLFPAVWIALLLLPSLVWVLVDKRVWPWDPAHYGYWTLQLALEWDKGLAAGLELNRHALKMMPPLLVWLGQLVLPLRHLIGSIDVTLMLVILSAGAGILALVYRLGRALGAGRLGAIAAVTVVGGGQLFIGLSHYYMTELVQSFAAALSVAIAWRCERRSAMRNAALVIVMIACAFLAKISSANFVLPALFYMAVALTATWGAPRRPVTRGDLGLMALAVFLMTLTVIWYVANWHGATDHLFQATVGDAAKHYGAPVVFVTKLLYWIEALGRALSFYRIVPVFLAIFVIGALIRAARDAFRQSPLVRRAVESGSLFGFYLAGTVVATVGAYSLQINEDQRFLVSLLPLIGSLVAWSIAVYESSVETAVSGPQVRRKLPWALAVLALGAINAVLIHASALGLMAPAGYFYLVPPNRVPDVDKALTRMVAATCRADSDAHPAVIAVSYAELNSNTANYYARKHELATGMRCIYWQMPQDDVQTSLEWIKSINARYVVTIGPAFQRPPNFVNTISNDMAARLASDSSFELLPDPDTQFLIYRRPDSDAQAGP